MQGTATDLQKTDSRISESITSCGKSHSKRYQFQSQRASTRRTSYRKKTNLLISFMQNPTGKLTRTTKKHQFEATKTHSTTKSNQRGKIYHLAVDSRGSRSMIRNLKKKTDLVSCIHLNIYRGTGSHLLS